MSTFQVHVFGQFRVLRDGEELPELSRQSATAFKMLVCLGSTLHPDRITGVIWPGEAPSVVSKRFRNLLVRVRAETGARIKGRRDSVTLLDPVDCDLNRFLSEGPHALSEVDGKKASLRACLELLDLWAGSPLQEHQYQEWAVNLRAHAFHLREQMWNKTGSAGGPGSTPPSAPRSS